MALSEARRERLEEKEEGASNTLVLMSYPWPQELDFFVSEARGFVSMCERSHSDEPPTDFRNECLRRLSALYYGAINMPEVPFLEAPASPSRDVQKRLTENLMALPFQYYAEPLEPANLDKNGDMAVGDLFDDFIDIHHDLSDGLWLWDQGHWEAAVWHWRLLHWHWSNHIISALHALHLFGVPDSIGAVNGQGTTS